MGSDSRGSAETIKLCGKECYGGFLSTHYMGVLLEWKAFVAAILGGRGSIMGAAMAGYMLGIFTAVGINDYRLLVVKLTMVSIK